MEKKINEEITERNSKSHFHSAEMKAYLLNKKRYGRIKKQKENQNEENAEWNLNTHFVSFENASSDYDILF